MTVALVMQEDSGRRSGLVREGECCKSLLPSEGLGLLLWITVGKLWKVLNKWME